MGQEERGAAEKAAKSAKVSREAVERLAVKEGVSVLAMLTTLQTAAAQLDDGEETLEALCALKAEIVFGVSP